MRYLIKFSYDGSDFYGYQKQPNKRTVEDELEKALFQINNHKETRVYSAGRTDRGVHAKNQAAHFDLSVDITLYKLKRALNSLLPEDIHINDTYIVDDNFYARFSVVNKKYCYYLNTGEYNPIQRKYIYQYNKKLDIDKINTAIKDFIGEHDFKSFTSKEAKKDNYVRNIVEASLKQEGDILIFKFVGNGFMKYQVRNMVGTLIKVGAGKLPTDIVEKILEDDKNDKFVYTARPEGLYLEDVYYK